MCNVYVWYFAAEKIDEEAFLLLDASALSIIIPHVGPRLKIASNLKKLCEVRRVF